MTTIGQLAALGIRLRYVRAGGLEWMHEGLAATARRAGGLEWMHEGLAATARRAVGVAILRRHRRA